MVVLFDVFIFCFFFFVLFFDVAFDALFNRKLLRSTFLSKKKAPTISAVLASNV